jgi:hypothetical protein
MRNLLHMCCLRFVGNNAYHRAACVSPETSHNEALFYVIKRRTTPLRLNHKPVDVRFAWCQKLLLFMLQWRVPGSAWGDSPCRTEHANANIWSLMVTMKPTILWDIMAWLCCRLILPGCMLGLHLNSEDETSNFLRDVSAVLPGYMILHARRQSWNHHLLLINWQRVANGVTESTWYVGHHLASCTSPGW